LFGGLVTLFDQESVMGNFQQGLKPLSAGVYGRHNDALKNVTKTICKTAGTGLREEGRLNSL
jgi:hypothetical protein